MGNRSRFQNPSHELAVKLKSVETWLGEPNDSYPPSDTKELGVRGHLKTSSSEAAGFRSSEEE